MIIMSMHTYKFYTQTHTTHTQRTELPLWHFMNSLQVYRLHHWSCAARQSLKLQGAPGLATWSCEYTHPHIKQAIQIIFSLCAAVIWKRLGALATSNKNINNLRSHLKIPLREEAMISSKDMNKLIYLKGEKKIF